MLKVQKSDAQVVESIARMKKYSREVKELEDILQRKKAENQEKQIKVIIYEPLNEQKLVNGVESNQYASFSPRGSAVNYFYGNASLCDRDTWRIHLIR